MKFTLSWLKQFLETSATVYEIAESLTDIGLEVEEVIDKTGELQKFKVARIINAKPHPSADKLKVCDVEADNGVIQVICGASNARAGIKVVLANIGVEIPSGKFKIKESTIRGEKSYGMLCSEAELLLASESKGIIELPENAIIGEPFTKYYNLDDPIFDVNIAPNRGDALGVYGIARDLAAKGIGILKALEIPKILGTFTPKTKLIVQDKEVCPLFTFREIKHLKNKPSPEWLQKLLKNINIKPISAIVDVTNYISYSFGQPIHAYDADKLKGNIIVGYTSQQHQESSIYNLDFVDNKIGNVDSSFHENDIMCFESNIQQKENNKFRALNGKEYLLSKSDLVVKDESGVQALAGIIGSLDSGCDSDTTNILLEAACFNAKVVAASGRRLQIDTDSKYRFERNVDRNFTEKALDIATNMIVSICGAGEVSEIVIAGEKEIPKKSLDFSSDYLEKITGIKLNIKEIEAILNKLCFITDTKEDTIKITPPSWRHDIVILEDIVEEITRIYGYNKIKNRKLPELKQNSNSLRRHKRISTFKRILASRGYDEVVTNSFMNSEDAKLFMELKEDLFLLNPISAGCNYMRPSILPNLLYLVQKNLARSIKDMAFFEIGPSFIDLNTEITCLTAIMIGARNHDNLHKGGRVYDIFDLKSDLELVLDYAGLYIDKCIIPDQTTPSYYHPTRSVSLMLGKSVLGYLGQIHPKILKHYGIKEEVFAFELNIANLPLSQAKFGKRDEFIISDYQANFRDYAFILNKDQPVGEIISHINNLNKKLVKSVTLFDIYSGNKLSEGKKSIAVRVKLQADDRTLNEDDLNSFSRNVITTVEQKFQGILRE